MANKPKPVYVSYYGELWRLSERKYRELLRTIALGKDWTPSKFGKRIADEIQRIDYMSPENAANVYHERYKSFPTFESCRASIAAKQ